MIIKNSVKQLLRSPKKTTSFFLLIVMSTTLLFIGLNLGIQIRFQLSKADEEFVTIGTVSQKEDAIATKAQWDVALGSYIYYEYPIYNNLLTVDLLNNVQNIEYLSVPEQRAYYGATISDTQIRCIDENDYREKLVAEICPIEDCYPNKPVEMEVIHVLYGEKNLEGKKILFCDHYSENTKFMEKNKTYIAYLALNPYNFDKHENWNGEMEYTPRLAYEQQESLWCEVTSEYYDTEEGQIWNVLADNLYKIENQMIPVIPTKDLELLYSFHQDDAIIVEGKTIDANEFKMGEKVCLISQDFSQNTGYEVGDSIEIQFHFIDYSDSTGMVSYTNGLTLGDKQLLHEDGTSYKIFQTDYFKIVGIYSYSKIENENQFGLGANAIIVPMDAVVENDNNIIKEGAMQEWNTSFRIKNGTTDKFIEEFSKIPESSFLEIKFYDNGYEQFKEGLENIMLIAELLFIVGGALIIVVIVFFLYFTIVRERKRTAIERALGFTKKQCISSLIVGILILNFTATIVGGLVGGLLSANIPDKMYDEKKMFSTEYTKGFQDDEMISFEVNDNLSVEIMMFMIIGQNLIVFFIGRILIEKNWGENPIYLLGRKGSD